MADDEKTKQLAEYSGVAKVIAAPVRSEYPRFDRGNFVVWATMMEWALEANELWEAVDPGGEEYLKGGALYRKDRQAITAICSVMPVDVQQHLISKKSAKEAWDTLKTLHLGHSRVREANLQTLLKSYENLRMGEDETVDAFAARVASMVNGIRGLGEKLEDISVVRRFLRAAPPRYMPIVSAIEQCVDLKTLTLDDLVGRFKAHDERMKLSYGDAKQDEYLMLTRAQWEAMVSKENNFDKASGSGGKYRPAKDTDEQSEKPRKKKFDKRKIRCHNCNLLGHFKSECKNPPKEKALMAQFGDESDMMLMCELVDKGPVLQTLAKEIVALDEERIHSHDYDSETRVNATDAGGDSESYIDATGISANFAGADAAIAACARPWRSSLVTDLRGISETRVEATDTDGSPINADAKVDTGAAASSGTCATFGWPEGSSSRDGPDRPKNSSSCPVQEGAAGGLRGGALSGGTDGFGSSREVPLGCNSGVKTVERGPEGEGGSSEGVSKGHGGDGLGSLVSAGNLASSSLSKPRGLPKAMHACPRSMYEDASGALLFACLHAGKDAMLAPASPPTV